MHRYEAIWPEIGVFTDCCEESFRSGVELPRFTRKMTDDCAWDNAIHFQEGVILDLSDDLI